MTTARPAAETGPASGNAGPATDDGGPSPIVPLVFAGIVILAAAGPWIAPRSRSTVYWVDRRW